MALNGLRVIAFESRRAVEIAVLIEKQGGVPFVAPSVREMPPADPAEALRFADRIELGEFDMLVCMTGVGLRLFLKTIAPTFDAERLARALRQLTIVARGPKPVAMLREWNVPVQVSIPEPNTSREWSITQTRWNLRLKDCIGRTVYQRHGMVMGPRGEITYTEEDEAAPLINGEKHK